MFRDLKPENIMLEDYDRDDIKIIDWGTSRKFDPDMRMKRLVGTVSYLNTLVTI